MPLVATLVSSPLHPATDDAFLTDVAQMLGTDHAPVILNPGIAADIVFTHDNATESETRLRDFIQDRPVDVFVQSNGERRKRLLIADMDSTMIRQECIDELAAELGLKEQISHITEQAMRGEIAFEPALKERVALLRGLPVATITKVLETRIDLMPGGRELVQTMKANGAWCALVSGGFTHFTKIIAHKIGFDENSANVLLEENGQLSGLVQEPVLGREAKRQRLEELMQAKNIPAEQTLAVGDGANDLAMIERAGLGIAYHAKPAVAQAADMRVIHGDLTALLYLQGYKSSEFHS